MLSQEDILRKYPRLVGHLICQSLGYFTPLAAANAIAHYMVNKPFFCEWYSYISHCKCGDFFNDEVVLTTNRKILEEAFALRRTHQGYMSEYKRAKVLVAADSERPDVSRLASWF